MVFTNKIMAKKKVDPLLNRISAVDAAARMWYSKRVLRLLKQNTPILKKTSPLWKKRPLPRKKKGKTIKMFVYPLLAPVKNIVTATIAQYSDFANFSEIAKHINLTWRGHIKQVSTIPAATVYHMLYLDMGQEW